MEPSLIQILAGHYQAPRVLQGVQQEMLKDSREHTFTIQIHVFGIIENYNASAV
jgi:hypothetical protein